MADAIGLRTDQDQPQVMWRFLNRCGPVIIAAGLEVDRL